MIIKAFAKSAAAELIHRSGLEHVFAAIDRRRSGGRRVIVLGYHRVVDNFERERSLGIESCLISSSTFRRHVAWLASRFELASMSRAVDVLQGRATAKRDIAVITFDDGYADVFAHAAPILKEFDVPATLYVSSDVVDSEGFFPHDELYQLVLRLSATPSMHARMPRFSRAKLEEMQAGGSLSPKPLLHDLLQKLAPNDIRTLCLELADASGASAALPDSMRAMGWKEVQTLARQGFEIGAHTATHAVLANAPEEESLEELSRSKRAIERTLDGPCDHFAYCNGYYSDALIAQLRSVGFSSAVTTEDRLNRVGSDPFRIARRVVWEGTARGVVGTSPGLLACQLGGAWRALGFDSSESGKRPSPLSREEPLRRLG